MKIPYKASLKLYRPMEQSDAKKKSISDRVFAVIRDGLANGTIVGTPSLSEVLLSKFVGKVISPKTFSRIHVRRAIAQLEQEGLLEVFPKKGTKLRVITDSELKEIWDNRVAIEEFILVRLATKRDRNFDNALDAHAKMDSTIRKFERFPVTEIDHQEFLRLDKLFHESLSNAANYPGLATELEMLRLKLQIAAPVKPFRSRDRYFAIVDEHRRILDALQAHRTGKADKVFPRPDINAVRMAFLTHMKNSSRDSWKIESRIRDDSFSAQSNAIDIPDFRDDVGPELIASEFLLQMRLSTEYTAVALLASRPDSNLDVPNKFQLEMHSIVRQCQDNKTELSLADQQRFLELDLSFHSSLSFCAGMLFGGEAIGYAWDRLWLAGVHAKDLARCRIIVSEHDRILACIRRSAGDPGDVQRATLAMENHLLGAFVRYSFDADTLLERTKLEYERQGRRFEKVIDALRETKDSLLARNAFQFKDNDP